MPVACRALAEAEHQIGAVDARGARMAERLQRPHERLAVGHGERGAEHGRTRLRVLLGRHHQVDSRRRQVPRSSGGDRRVHPVDDLLVVGYRERNAENLGGAGATTGVRGEGLDIA